MLRSNNRFDSNSKACALRNAADRTTQTTSRDTSTTRSAGPTNMPSQTIMFLFNYMSKHLDQHGRRCCLSWCSEFEAAMAMRSFHSSILLVTLALLPAALMLPRANSAKQSVRIRNEMPGVLAVHCKSHDDDLGQRYLPAGGTPYYFAFKENLWGTTLFWCTFNYGPVMWNTFDVWQGPRLFGKESKIPCEQCLWAVRPNAFYRAQEGPAPLVAIWPWRTDPHAMVSDPQARNASDLHNETHSVRDSALAANASQTVGS